MEGIVSRSPEETLSFGMRLGKGLLPGDVVILTGELGSGKTVLAKGICMGLGLEDPRQVTSPSFTLLQIYEGRIPIYHMDYYRLGTKEEVTQSGLDPFSYWEGVVLVEWGERFPDLLTRTHIQVRIKYLEEEARLIEARQVASKEMYSKKSH